MMVSYVSITLPALLGIVDRVQPLRAKFSIVRFRDRLGIFLSDLKQSCHRWVWLEVELADHPSFASSVEPVALLAVV